RLAEARASLDGMDRSVRRDRVREPRYRVASLDAGARMARKAAPPRSARALSDAAVANDSRPRATFRSRGSVERPCRPPTRGADGRRRRAREPRVPRRRSGGHALLGAVPRIRADVSDALDARPSRSAAVG